MSVNAGRGDDCSHPTWAPAARQAAGRWFVGVLKAVQQDMSHRPGRYIGDLELIGVLGDPADYEDRVQHLPL